ncbi:hypothetical protein QCN27_03775 [Cereibacter sp. SYSU M97828]|nr:hypothetical protein [Cereibacter flavus]
MALKKKADCTPEEWEEVRAKRRQKSAAYRAKYPERYREANARKNREWRKKNPAAAKAATKRYEDAHPEAVAAGRARRRYGNMAPEAVAKRQEQRRAWKLANPDRVAHHKFMARLRQADRDAKGKRAVNREVTALMTVVRQSLPSTLPRQVMEDAQGEAILLIMSGDCIDPKQAARKALQLYWRQYTKFGVVSLDEPIPGFDGLRRIDTIPANHFEAFV